MLQVLLKMVRRLRMLLFHHVHLLVDLSWLTTWLTEMPKVVSASAGVLPVWVWGVFCVPE